MEIKIITYNHKAVKNGERIAIVGFLLFVCLFIPTFGFNYGSYITTVAFLLILSGFSMVVYYRRKLISIGSISFKNDTAIIRCLSEVFSVSNDVYKVNISNNGFKGQNQTDILEVITTGIAWSSEGINEIVFSNATNILKYEIMINNRYEWDNLIFETTRFNKG